MAKDYYNLAEDAKFRDVVLSVRADETIHREVNHYITDNNTDTVPLENEHIYIVNRDNLVHDISK